MLKFLYLQIRLAHRGFLHHRYRQIASIMGHTIFITGGCRSGKSTHALARAQALGAETVFIATCRPGDAEMERRIARHRAERPAAWRTVEEYGPLADVLRSETQRDSAIILDCLTLYVSNLLVSDMPTGGIIENIREIAEIIAQGAANAIVVSNEVGWGIVPDNALARDFRDIAGTANQIVAARANEVICMIAGIPMRIK